MDQLKENTLLQYCFENKKHQAFDLIIEKSKENKKIDINKKNENSRTTIYGSLFHSNNKVYYHENNYQPAQKLERLLITFGDKIDRNSPQIDLKAESL